MMSQRLFSTEKLVLLTVVLFVGVTVTPVNGQIEVGSCKPIELKTVQLGSVDSAIWIARESAIAVADWWNKQVVLLGTASLDDGVQRLTKRESLEQLFDAKVGTFSLRRAGNQFVHLDQKIRQRSATEIEVNIRARWFDENFDFVGVTDVSADGGKIDSRRGPPLRIFSLLDWTVAGDLLFGYGSYGEAESDYEFQMGFVKQELRAPGNRLLSQAHLVMPLNDFEYYNLGFPYMAPAGRKLFFLVLRNGDFPSLYRYDPEVVDWPERLDGFPGEDKRLPVIDVSLSPEQGFPEIAKLEMPRGLYEQSGKLYSLHRRLRSGSLGREWVVYTLNPTSDGVVAAGSGDPLVLPTSAEFVTLLLTPKHWFIFEQTGPYADGRWEIPRMWACPLSKSGIPASHSAMRVSGD